MNSSPIKILVLFYSFGGHTAELARFIAEGAKEVDGVEVELKQVPELLPENFFADKPELLKERQAMQAIPVATVDDLKAADGVAFGSPVHFGSLASQLKQFIDQLSPVYVKGTMAGKPAAAFVSCGSTHGGEEAALLSIMTPLFNLGMLPVGVPYPLQGEGLDFDAGSPYGAIYISGHKGDKMLKEDDKKVARVLGKRLAAVTKVVKQGSMSCPDCEFLTQPHV